MFFFFFLRGPEVNAGNFPSSQLFVLVRGNDQKSHGAQAVS